MAGAKTRGDTFPSGVCLTHQLHARPSETTLKAPDCLIHSSGVENVVVDTDCVDCGAERFNTIKM